MLTTVIWRGKYYSKIVNYLPRLILFLSFLHIWATVNYFTSEKQRFISVKGLQIPGMCCFVDDCCLWSIFMLKVRYCCVMYSDNQLRFKLGFIAQNIHRMLTLHKTSQRKCCSTRGWRLCHIAWNVAVCTWRWSLICDLHHTVASWLYRTVLCSLFAAAQWESKLTAVLQPPVIKSMFGLNCLCDLIRHY